MRWMLQIMINLIKHAQRTNWTSVPKINVEIRNKKFNNIQISVQQFQVRVSCWGPNSGTIFKTWENKRIKTLLYDRLIPQNLTRLSQYTNFLCDWVWNRTNMFLKSETLANLINTAHVICRKGAESLLNLVIYICNVML